MLSALSNGLRQSAWRGTPPEGVNRGHVKRGNQLFQLREQDTDQPGDRTFQLGALLLCQNGIW